MSGIAELGSRLRSALSRRPRAGSGRAFLQELALLAPLLALLGWLGGWLMWSPDFSPATAKLLAIAIIAPALGEELLFRAALLPAAIPERDIPAIPMCLSAVLFVLWHPLQSLIYEGPFAALMLDGWFLLAVAALGVACGRIYWRTGSIWPAVALHWLVVAVFKAFFSAPSPW